jgi:hypothetical protein
MVMVDGDIRRLMAMPVTLVVWRVGAGASAAAAAG